METSDGDEQRDNARLGDASLAGLQPEPEPEPEPESQSQSQKMPLRAMRWNERMGDGASRKMNEVALFA
ncbi:hypothetical protein DHEL01_v208001 [Diaporthe helianthi]|uniref:Uncharacterized protein n=1 Tax=Diaporthe helianthi TaxID=158607 RepID=A0A2P5HTM9_DIAHE|nr:hypothetical protein DHEL01_v208001 [Diaporthe helianthi]